MDMIEMVPTEAESIVYPLLTNITIFYFKEKKSSSELFYHTHGTFYIKEITFTVLMQKKGQTLIAEDEKRILAELQKNAKESIDAIAKRCKYSRQKVWRCIKRLEQNRVIWGYTAIIDEEKQNRKSYVLAIKKTTNPLDEKTVNLITSPYLYNLASKEGVIIENSFYTHGEYDWIITFTADDLRQAKKFSEILNTTYQRYISKMDFMETLFWTRKQRIFNPEAKKLKELLF